MLEVRHVTKKYREKAALSDVSFTLERGVYGLLGPNGAGKSTLMKILTLQISPCQGEVLWDGVDIGTQKETYLGSVGYMPQQQNIYPGYTTEEFVYYMGALHGMPDDQIARRADELFMQLGLEQKRRSKVAALSGGMKQRLLLLQAVINRPKVLILDEPTAGLDPQQRIVVRNLIMELAVECTVLLATHVVQDVELISKEVLLLKEGNLIARGNHAALCQKLHGKVFEFVIPQEKLREYQNSGLVSTVRENINGQYVVRLISDQSPAVENCRECEATLEEVSLYYFGRENI